MAKEAADDETAPVLETFIPRVNFSGYPFDLVTEVQFNKGVPSVPVSPEYAALIREKGLAAKK